MTKPETLVSDDLTSVKLDLGVDDAIMLDAVYYVMNLLQKNYPERVFPSTAVLNVWNVVISSLYRAKLFLKEASEYVTPCLTI
tara:strand:- start:299 stop:547 length:249 start_codon:yes stop_codon:yes gene_type:complete